MHDRKYKLFIVSVWNVIIFRAHTFFFKFHEPISAIDFGIMHRFWEDETKIDRNLIVETHLTVDCDGECGFFCGGVCFGIMRGKGG